jgi:Na+/phosphate symporter
VLFFVAAAIFMVREARRLAIPHVWAYLVGGMLIAISVTFPLFLVAREFKLNSTDATRSEHTTP